MKVGTIVNSQETLAKLMEVDLPINLAVSLKSKMRQMEDTLKIFEEKRTKLFSKYGTETGKEGELKVENDNIAEFSEKLSEILDAEVEVEITKVPLQDLVDAGVKLNVKDLFSIDWLIAE